jgi:hypothetical protein
VRAEQGWRVIDVTRPPFNPKGHGKTDGTATLIAANAGGSSMRWALSSLVASQAWAGMATLSSSVVTRWPRPVDDA